jgi:hypothetical protein
MVTALACPASASPVKLQPIGYTVSGTYPGYPASYVSDGNTSTFWNAGNWTGYIELDLGQAMPISKIRLLPYDDRSGTAVHTITAGGDHNSMRTVYSYSGPAGPNLNNTWIEFSGDGANGDHLGHVRYIRITTTSNPSWLAWSEIEVYGAVEYFGYYNMYSTDIAPTSAAGANLMELWATDANIVSQLATTGQYHSQAIVFVQPLVFSGSGLLGGAGCSSTDPGCWRYQWNAWATTIKSSGYQANIATFYLFDEPDFWGVSPSDLSTLSAQIKTDFPSATTSLILTNGAVANPVPANSTLQQIIQAPDWVGFDCYTAPPGNGYGTWNNCSNWGNGVSMPTLISNLRAALRPTQRMIAMPTAMTMDTSASVTDQEWEIENNIGYWHSEILSDWRYVMVWPYLWEDNPQTNFPHEKGAFRAALIQSRLKQLAASFMPMWNGSAMSMSPNIFVNGWTTSGTYSGTAAFGGFDGDSSTIWNSGGWAPAWIQAWIWDYTRVHEIDLTMLLDRPGTSYNRLKIRTASGWQQVTDFAGQSEGDYVRLIWTGNADINAIEVDTDSDPSWVAWRDIMILK